MAQPWPTTAFHQTYQRLWELCSRNCVRIIRIIGNGGSSSIHWTWSWADVNLEQLPIASRLSHFHARRPNGFQLHATVSLPKGFSSATTASPSAGTFTRWAAGARESVFLEQLPSRDRGESWWITPELFSLGWQISKLWTRIFHVQLQFAICLGWIYVYSCIHKSKCVYINIYVYLYRHIHKYSYKHVQFILFLYYS